MKNIIFIPLFFLIGCSTAPNSVAPTNEYADIDQYFISGTSSSTKSEMASLIRLLPDNIRQNQDIILVDLANRITYSSQNQSTVMAYDESPPRIQPAALVNNGPIMGTLGASEPTCTTGAANRYSDGRQKPGTGVMYRIHTPPGTYDRLKNRVTLPPETQIYDFSRDLSRGADTATVYMGGIGDRYNALEVGLQHNSAQSTGPGGDWSPYIASFAGRTRIRQDLIGPARKAFDSGTAVMMELVLVGEGTPDNYAVYISNGTSNGRPARYAIAAKLTASNKLSDWQLPVQSLRFFRATTIAQTNVLPGLEYANNFSFLNGVKWDLGSYGRTLGFLGEPTTVWRGATGCNVPGNNFNVIVQRPLGNTVEQEVVTVNSNTIQRGSLSR
jgi:hypothetical protein